MGNYIPTNAIEAASREVFNTEFDTNLLSKISNTEPASNNHETVKDEMFLNLESGFSKHNLDTNHRTGVDHSQSEEFHDASPEHRREVAAESPESPTENLSKANPALRTPNKLPTPKKVNKPSNAKVPSNAVQNGMDNDVHLRNTDRVPEKEQNTNTQSSAYSEADIQALIEAARLEERNQWVDERQKLERASEQKSGEIVGLKSECQSLVEMSQAPMAAPPPDNSLDVKMTAALNNAYAEKLISSRQKSEEMLTKHIKKLSSDNSEILKELDVMHSAMSDLHKRYDRAREVINNMKKREDTMEEKIREFAEDLKNSEDNCRFISKSCDDQLEAANARIEQAKLEFEKEKVMMEATIKRLEIDSKSWHSKFLDKESSEKELIAICDSLMGVKEQEMAESGEQESSS